MWSVRRAGRGARACVDRLPILFSPKSKLARPMASGQVAYPRRGRKHPMSFTTSNSILSELDANQLIGTLYKGFAECLDMVDGRGTAVTDPVERLRLRLELQSRSLLLCAVPAPNSESVRMKVEVVAFIRSYGEDLWTASMLETAIEADMAALQLLNAWVL